MPGRWMSGTSRRFPRHFYWTFFLGNEEEEVGLEVPDVLLPDIRDHPIFHRKFCGNAFWKVPFGFCILFLEELSENRVETKEFFAGDSLRVGGEGVGFAGEHEERGNVVGRVGCGVGTGKGTGKLMRMHLSKLPFSKLPLSFSPREICSGISFWNPRGVSESPGDADTQEQEEQRAIEVRIPGLSLIRQWRSTKRSRLW